MSPEGGVVPGLVATRLVGQVCRWDDQGRERWRYSGFCWRRADARPAEDHQAVVDVPGRLGWEGGRRRAVVPKSHFVPSRLGVPRSTSKRSMRACRVPLAGARSGSWADRDRRGSSTRRTTGRRPWRAHGGSGNLLRQRGGLQSGLPPNRRPETVRPWDIDQTKSANRSWRCGCDTGRWIPYLQQVPPRSCGCWRCVGLSVRTAIAVGSRRDRCVQGLRHGADPHSTLT